MESLHHCFSELEDSLLKAHIESTEGSQASGLFCNEKQECKVHALHNKQTGHCMASSQDVLPSTEALAGLGLEEKPARAQSEPH